MGSRVLGEAIGSIRNWSVTEAKEPRAARATEAFGSLVFNDEVQQTRLPKPVYHALRRTMTHGEPLDISVADADGTCRSPATTSTRAKLAAGCAEAPSMRRVSCWRQA